MVWHWQIFAALAWVGFIGYTRPKDTAVGSRWADHMRPRCNSGHGMVAQGVGAGAGNRALRPCPLSAPFCVGDVPIRDSGGRCYGAAELKLDRAEPGKHCRWIKDGLPVCVDCLERGLCGQLQPAGKCAPFKRSLDDREATLSHSATDGALGWTLHWPSRPPPSRTDRPYRASTHFMPECTVLSSRCFNFSRCFGVQAGGAMSVHVVGAHRGHANNTQRMWDWLDQASKAMPGRIVPELDHDRACLVIVHSTSFPDQLAMESSPSFRNGQNHFIWMANMFEDEITSACKDASGANLDASFATCWDWGLAAVGASSLTRATRRSGYDMVLPLAHPTIAERGDLGPPYEAAALAARAASTDTQRRHLLSFKGTVLPSRDSWENHRWIAAEFLHDPANGIISDGDCKYEGNDANLRMGYSHPEHRYLDLLQNSTFVFAAGGCGSHSYRFAEILGLGAIPVTTADQLLPFDSELDWDRCVVRVSETRLLELPDILGQIGVEEIRSRRRACWALLDGAIGTVVTFKGQAGVEAFTAVRDKGAFMMAMRLWHARLERRAHQAQLLLYLSG